MGPRRGPNRAHVVRPPVGSPWSPDFAVVRRGPRSFSTTLDTSTLIPTTTASFYADSTKANNGGNGTSAATAEQAIWAALNDVGAGVHATVYILGSADSSAPTIYPWTKAWRVGTSANLKVSVVSDFTTLAAGYAVSSTALVAGDGELGAWGLTADPSGPNVYEATVATAPGRVVDGLNLDADGVATKLALQTSIALVEANPGSYYHAGGVLYVRTFDSRAPTFPTLRPLRGGAATNGLANGGRTVYIERLSFEGGDTARAFFAQNANVTLVDCDVTNSPSLGFEVNVPGTTTNTTRTAHLIRCRFIANAGDGCGYAASGTGMTIRGFEWDCEYKRNSGAGTDQGGSAHHDATPGGQSFAIVRVNPTCSANKSQGFADVGENDEGCYVWISGGSISGEAVGVYAGNGTRTWLHETVLSSCTVDFRTDDAAGRIYTAGVDYSASKVDGDGQVGPYSP